MRERDRGPRRVQGVNALALGLDGTPSGEVEVVALRATFVDFYREQRPSLVRALTVTLGDRQLAEDATDEAMTRAYQHWQRVGRMDNPGGWVYRVGLNWSVSLLRRKRRADSTASARMVEELPAVDEPSVLVALRRLSVDHRAVVVCRYLLGWSEAETAKALGIHAGTAKSRAARAVVRLPRRARPPRTGR